MKFSINRMLFPTYKMVISMIKSEMVTVILIISYIVIALSTCVAYWHKTQSSYYSSMCVPEHISHPIKIQHENGWHIKLTPTDSLLICSAIAGFLWPFYLMCCIAYRVTKNLAI